MEIWGENDSKFTTQQLRPFFKFFSNSFKFFFKLKSIPIKYAKLEKDLQLILGSLGNFLLTKINLSNLFYYK